MIVCNKDNKTLRTPWVKAFRIRFDDKSPDTQIRTRIEDATYFGDCRWRDTTFSNNLELLWLHCWNQLNKMIILFNSWK